MAKQADLGKAGGILAFGGGLLQTLIGVLALQTGRALGAVGISRGDEGLVYFALVATFITMIVGSLLISGARAMIPGIVLIVCALLSIVGGEIFIVGIVLGLTAGILALIADFFSGTGGYVAAVARMAKAAKEAEAEDAGEKKG